MDDRRALLNAGPVLRDVDAAVECPCGCHPRVGDLHDGGVTCPCQKTPEEREADMKEFLAAMAELNYDSNFGVQKEEFDTAAVELGVTDAVIECQAVPTVVSGVVDGRFFYLRERHGTWRVTIAPDDDPLLDVWDHTTIRQGVDIASGSEDDLYPEEGQFSFAHVLEFAVQVVRDYLRRNVCSHAASRACVHANFCPTCGVRLADVGG